MISLKTALFIYRTFAGKREEQFFLNVEYARRISLISEIKITGKVRFWERELQHYIINTIILCKKNHR